MVVILRTKNNGSKRFNTVRTARSYAKKEGIRRPVIAKPVNGGFKIYI